MVLIMAKANEPAYPAGNVNFTGLTKRELFAAMAMQGLIAKSGYYDYTAKKSVEIANAMILELEKGSK